MRNVYTVFLFLLADGALYTILFFKCVEQNLFIREGIVPGIRGTALVLAGVGCVILLNLAFARLYNRKVRKTVLVELGIFLPLIYLPSLLFTLHAKASSFLWLPLQWHMLPETLVLFVRISPVYALGQAAAIAALVWLAFVKKRGLLVLGVGIGLTGLVLIQVSLSDGDFLTYALGYLSPMFLALAGFALGYPRLFTRGLIMAGCTVLIFWYYIGVFPLHPGEGESRDPSIRVLYPPPDTSSDIDLAFLQYFVIDARRNYLFTSYGPTCGIVRLDLDTHALEIIPSRGGLVRYLWSTDALDTLYGIDWRYAELLTLEKDPFGILHSVDVYRPPLNIPLSFDVSKDKIYIIYTEYPGIGEFDRETLKLERSILFKDQGYIPYSSGGWRASLDPERGKIFVALGRVNTREEDAILSIDLDTFQVDGQVNIPLGGPELIRLPEKGTLLTPSFFTRTIYEHHMDDLTLKRTFQGPLNCRNIVYDPKRDLLYAVGFMKGELSVIRYPDAEILKTVRIGNKAYSMALLPERDELYVGSMWGILKVDLKELNRLEHSDNQTASNP